MTQLQEWIDRLDNTAELSSLKAEFQVVTPMFIGDGKQEAASIRPPAIKGALRFWWRALNWSRCLEKAGSETAALNQLHKEEAEIFGLAAKQDSEGNQQGGQGVFSLKVIQQIVKDQGWSPGSGTQYLLGQGLWHFRDKLLRDFIPGGSTFTVELGLQGNRLKKAADELLISEDKIINSLDDALFAFGLLGSLGSRARKGLGSISVTAFQGSRWSVPQSEEEYQQTLKQLLNSATSAKKLPPFTALSAYSRLDISCSAQSSVTLLETIGEEMQMYRSWGRKGKVNNKPAEQNFPDDHDQALLATQGEQPRKAPKRAVFGLPHNYFFSSTGGKVDIHVKKDAAGERRASPLLIHFHLLSNGNYAAVQLLLPAVFLPGSNPMLEYKSKRSFTLPVTDAGWPVITQFMDRFKDKETIIATNLQGER